MSVINFLLLISVGLLLLLWVRKQAFMSSWFRVEIPVQREVVFRDGISEFPWGYVSCLNGECIVGFNDRDGVVFVRYFGDKIIFEGSDRDDVVLAVKFLGGKLNG